MKSNTPSVHGGHRARMRKRFFETGGIGFSPHEFLEMILYSAIPTKDTNPLAHQLINHFGSLDAVLSASDEELRAVPGIGPKTSALIRSVNELCIHYDQNRFVGHRTIVDVPSAVYRARTAAPSRINTELIVLYENNDGTLMTVRTFPGRLGDPEINRELLTVALSLHTHSVIILFKEFRDLRTPSRKELVEISQLVRMLSMTEIYTVDYIMLSGDHIYSFRQAELIRDEKNSFRESLPNWHHWYAPLLNYPCENNWYHVPMTELEKLQRA